MSKTERHPIHLCIGSPRSGTTWLFNNLKDTDLVFMPIVKETRYWWGGPSENEKNRSIKAARSASGASDPRQSLWLDRWSISRVISGPDYIDLMSQPDQPTLDISPSYCTMPATRIEDVFRALPSRSKVIYIVRNPFHRISSQFKLHAYYHGTFRGPASDGTLMDAINGYPQKLWQNYNEVIVNWSRIFGDRFRVFYYDDMLQDRMAFLVNILDFLDLDAARSDLDADKVDRYFNTDRNQPTRSILPSLTTSQKSIVASHALRHAQDFKAVDPAMSDRWVKEIRKHIPAHSDFRPTPCEVNPGYERLLRMSENLGDNCEFAFFQRNEGYEPSSLFRWSLTPADKLLDYLHNRQPLFEKHNLAALASPTSVFDRGSGFYFPSNLIKRDAAERRLLTISEGLDEIYEEEKKNVDWLSRKFWTFMSNRPCLFVIKSNKGIKESVVDDIYSILREFNNNHMLLHVTSGGSYALEEGKPGKYIGCIPSFADYSTANNIQIYAWRRMFHDLAKKPMIENLIEKMFV